MIPLVPWQYKDAVEENTQKRLQALMPPEPWCNPEFLVRFDFPAEGILKIAKDREADLIVLGLGKPTTSELTSHLPGSVAYDVVSGASCPVLTVRG